MKDNNIELRLKNLRQKLSEKNIDAALITKRENYIYLSGFTGSFAQLIITENDAIIVTDFRYEEQASAEAPMYQAAIYRDNITDAIGALIKSRGVKTLGFEEGHLTYEKYTEYKSSLSVKEMVPLEKMVEKLRSVKSEEEIQIIKNAVDISDKAFEHIIHYIKPGVRELEIALELEYFMKKQGASRTSFETIVASGKRSSLPHGVASERAVEYGDAITLDFGAVYQGYCSDMTRTVFLGQPHEQLRRIYGIVLKAQLEAISHAASGLTGKQIDGVARKIISEAGYGGNFGHGLGHGVGLEIHEDPRLSPTGNAKMEKGMTVTVEPGIYISGLGGVRIEDIILIKEDGAQVLTKSTKEMIII